jgi:hypothetical protein
MGKAITGGHAPMGATIVTQKVAKSVAAAALRAQLRAPVPPAERAQYELDVAEVGVVECAVDEAIALALD